MALRVRFDHCGDVLTGTVLDTAPDAYTVLVDVGDRVWGGERVTVPRDACAVVPDVLPPVLTGPGLGQGRTKWRPSALCRQGRIPRVQ